MEPESIKEILIGLGAGATATLTIMEVIKKYKGMKGDKADLLGKMEKALEEVYETNLSLRTEILDLRNKLSEYQLKESNNEHK